MKEIEGIIKRLEKIFPIVNGASADAAEILKGVIIELENLPIEKEATLENTLKAIDENPDFFIDLIKEVGLDTLFTTLMKIKGISDDLIIHSRRIPNLDNFPIQVLKTLRTKLEKRKQWDPEAEFMLNGLNEHLKRREGKEKSR